MQFKTNRFSLVNLRWGGGGGGGGGGRGIMVNVLNAPPNRLSLNQG